jgi:hypothetical protein
MVFDSAIVLLAAILNVAGVSSSEKARVPRVVITAPVKIAAPAKLWPAKKKKSKPRRAPRHVIEEREEQELLRAPPSRPRERSEDEADEGEGQETEAEAEPEEEEEEEEKPVPKRAKKRDVEEDEEDEDEAEPLASLPSIVPRLVTFGVGGSVLRRSFAYASDLQGDTDLPRFGYRLALEAYPLLRLPGAPRMLGLGVWYEQEYGNAGASQTDGSTISFPVNHGRWGFDLRYAFTLGERVVLAPALGFGKTTADLGRNMPIAPLMCTATPASTPPCFGDVNASHLVVDIHLRIAATPTLALSLAGGYLPGLSVSRGTGGIAAMADASMTGFHVQLGANLMLNDIFALQASIPYWRYGYTFSTPAGGMPTPGAKDQYYGLVVGIAVMAP